jgi:hypothetical protein
MAASALDTVLAALSDVIAVLNIVRSQRCERRLVRRSVDCLVHTPSTSLIGLVGLRRLFFK